MAPDFVFEISSEAGRKVGGIYTVLKTKSWSAIGKFGSEKYFLFGRYDPVSARDEFQEELPVPEDFAKVFSALERGHSIKCRLGKWTNGNGARLILVDPWEFGKRQENVPYGKEKDLKINAIKHYLWKDWGVDSIFMSGDFNENVIWSTAVGVAIEALLTSEGTRFHGKKVACHFHEWISGAGLLYLRSRKVPAGTVFTTHATVLGRSKTTFGENLSRVVEEGLATGKTAQPDEAYRFKLEGKHFLEVACAKNAHAFTTVSETVGREVEYILGKKPDVITLNGISLSKGAISREKRAPKREEIENLVHAMFLQGEEVPRTDNALFIYLTARYEFENKGIDYFISAAGKLLKKGLPKELYFFIFVPSNISGPNKEILVNLGIVDRMRENAEEVSGKKLSLNEILSRAENDKSFKEISALRKNMVNFGNAKNSAFDLNYSGDAILSKISSEGLSNGKGTRVKIIFYPTYLKPGDGLLNLEYDEVMAGCDIGVFPSRYEPFGYTPVEAAVSGNASITTDYSGFGKFIATRFGKQLSGKVPGVSVVETLGKTDDQISEEIASILGALSRLREDELEGVKMNALEMIKALDWEIQMENYVSAYKIACERAEKEFGKC